MAVVVDGQNAKDKTYKTMAPSFRGTAYKAAMQLCTDGRVVLNGYTEYVLHDKREEAKAGSIKSSL
jgi:malate synthase